MLLMLGAMASILQFDTRGPQVVAALETKVKFAKHGLRAHAHSNEMTQDVEEETTAEFCSLDTSLIDPFLNPPKPVLDFLMTRFGVGWAVSTFQQFTDRINSTDHVCGKLGEIMNSNKDFVLLTVGDRTSNSSLLMGDDAAEELCASEQERTSSEACPETTAEVAEKEVENPGSFGLGEVLPICMGLRFCNDDDVIDGSVKFGFVTKANNGAGMDFGYIGPCAVSFEGLAFDSAGGLPFVFGTPLLNPNGGERIARPNGAHFLLKGSMRLPLSKKIESTGETKSLGTVAITSADFGTYSELEVDGTTTADIVKVFRYLGDLEELASNLDRLSFQLFVTASAQISLNLGEIFPLPGNFNMTLFDGSLSSMIDIQVQTPDRRDERKHWYIGEAGQTCNQVCTTFNRTCTENSIHEQSSLIYSGEAHEAFHEADVMCSEIRDGIPGFPFQSPDGCYKFTPGGDSSTCDAIGSTSQASLCYCEEHDAVEAIATNNAVVCNHEDETWMQDTYIAASVSAEISTGDLDHLLSPLATFGEFLSGLIPGSNVTNGTAPNPVEDVTRLALRGRTYLKLPLSGPAHFILQFDVAIEIKCDFINYLRDWSGFMWEHLPGTAVIDTFCNMTERNIGVTVSIGFRGFAIDAVNSYLEFNAGDHRRRIDFDVFPTCPPPVLTGGSCAWNSDCMSSDLDPEATTCSAYDGYCLNDPVWKTSLGCSGRCIDKLPDGADCSGEALNKVLSLTERVLGGDDDACQSGRCSPDLICAPTLPLGERCLEDEDCTSGRCASDFTCKPKAAEGEGCAEDEDCMSGGCSWALTCGTTCRFDSDCSTGRCSRWLICEPKLPIGESCGADDDCVSDRCASNYTCQALLAIDERCMHNNDCESNICAWGFFGLYCSEEPNKEYSELISAVVE